MCLLSACEIVPTQSMHRNDACVCHLDGTAKTRRALPHEDIKYVTMDAMLLTHRLFGIYFRIKVLSNEIFCCVLV
jgi:hypothetical protein